MTPSLRLRVAPGAERGCFGIATVMLRDRSSSHSPHHATGGREYGGLARGCKTTLWSVIRYLTQLPSRALFNSCLRCGQRHRAAGHDVMLCRTLLHSCHGRTARFNPSTTASRFDERLLKVMYFQPFSSGRVEYVKSGYRPLERVPGERTTTSSQQPGPRRMPQHQHLLGTDPPSSRHHRLEGRIHNHHRRHSALGYQTPASYAAACTHR